VHLGHIEIFVADPLAARAFYETIGFSHEETQGGRFVWLASGGTKVLRRPGRRAGSAMDSASYGEATSAIVLYCDDLERAMARLRAAGVEFSGNDGGERCPTFRDPDGNWFQLVDPRSH
jgi:catechol 2,3-dioxygenase-like lactoylglutathione lyase family enzyme